MSSTAPSPRGVPRALRPFRLPAYRRLATALTTSLLASGIWHVAMVWEVLRIGGGPGDLSTVAAAATVATLVSLLLGGVAADRIPQKRILLTVHATTATAMTAVAALAATGQTRVWHLVVVAAVTGTATAFSFPAYTALVPALVPPDDLHAVNGVEGVVRPTMMSAAGPALAGVVIGVASPGAAAGASAVAALVAVIATILVPATPVRADDREPSPGPAGLVRDLRVGGAYLLRTRWLLASLLVASLMVMAMVGPLYVVLPFLLRDELGAGAGGHAAAMAAVGVGGAVGSLFVASLRFPRRYLTVMVGLWGLAGVPLLVIGVAGHLAVVLVAAFVLGALFSAPNVLWGTVLQRRVPPALLGRIASLDFLVSNAFTPASMALAGPLALAVGASGAFLTLGAVPLLAVLAVLAIGRLGADETAHPLHDDGAPERVETADVS